MSKELCTLLCLALEAQQKKIRLNVIGVVYCDKILEKQDEIDFKNCIQELLRISLLTLLIALDILRLSSFKLDTEVRYTRSFIYQKR